MSTANAQVATGGVPAGWETRIYPGVQVAGVSLAARYALASALGEAGVEAEYFLTLLATFPGSDQPSLALAEGFYIALEAWAARMVAAAAALEVATQGYLGELDALHPEIRDESSPRDVITGDMAGIVAGAWWTPFAGYALTGEPLALRLRRCGQSYRQVAVSRLPVLVEDIGEQMALLLHALAALPPAGVTPLRALYQGLNELTMALQGDVAPRRIRDLSQDYPGLITTLVTLRASLVTPAPIEADISWAREQVAQLRADRKTQRRGLGARLFGGFRRKSDAARASENATREWESVIAALVSLQKATTR
jgi:hypothetical protein